MEQPEKKQESPENGDAARALRQEAEKALSELKAGGGAKGFFSFEKFYFPAFARSLFLAYCVLIVLCGIGRAVGAFASMAGDGFATGLWSLILCVVGTAVSLAAGRVGFELALAAFRNHEALQDIREALCRKKD